MSKNIEAAAVNVNSNLHKSPIRRTVDQEGAKRMAEKCTDYNSSHSDSRNFKCAEFNGVKFEGENLSGIEAHYSKFANCEFEECNLSNLEGHFAEFENCSFQNCNMECSNFSFAFLTEVTFTNCNLNGTDFPFARGGFSCVSCMMERCTAQNSVMKLQLTETNARGFDANSSQLEVEISRCNLRGSEMNDANLKGSITQTDLTRAEFNRSDLTELQLIDCATNGLETEDANGYECSDDDLDSIFDDE